MDTTEETLASLISRYADPDEPLPDIPRVRLPEALREGDDPLHILTYLSGRGIGVAELGDLLRINDDGAEEEVRCFRVAEGVAVTVASDGLWLLFEP